MTRTPEVAATARDPNIPRSFHKGSDGSLKCAIAPREIAEAVRSGTGELWVDIDSTNRHQIALLEKVFAFHPLAIEDTLNPNSRVKLEEYEGYIFLIIRGVRFLEETEDPYDLDTFNICFFLGENYLVTVHAGTSASIESVAEQVERSPESLGRGVERLMHAVMDVAVDAYFPLMDQLDAFIDGLEESVFVQFDQAALRDIFSVKRLVLSLRRHLAPQREVFNILTNRPSALLTPETQVYFRDIYDHTLRINDSIDTYRDLLNSVMDSYLTQTSNRLGSVTKGLSVIATASIPFVVVSGMWGMNFIHVPLEATPFGFWIMLVIQLAIGGGLLWLLHRKGLL
ncbi:MAG: magnesium/cobalt transporter CorA [Gemmatimonadaceae bacterium]